MFKLKCVLKIPGQTRGRNATGSKQGSGNALERVAGRELFRDEGHCVGKRTCLDVPYFLFSR